MLINNCIKIISFSCFLLSFITINAQDIIDSVSYKKIDYKTYMDMVSKNNIGYLAEKFNVDIAVATTESAKVFPNPELNFAYTDNQDRTMKLGRSFNTGISWTLELGNKRKARIDLAQNQSQLSSILLEEYFRNLRIDATISYFTSIKNRHFLEVQTSSYELLKKLAKADSIHNALGNISEIDVKQSNLEALTQLNEVYDNQAKFKSSLLDLALLTGSNSLEETACPIENLMVFERDFDLRSLIITAQNNRLDLKVALQNKNISYSNLKLTKANRALDLGLSVNVDRNTIAKNEEAPTPAFTSVGAGITIPLKFSNRNKGELKIANYEMKQAEMNYKFTELNIQKEVTEHFYQYQTIKKKLDQFKKGMLASAKEVLDGKTYSYRVGESSLLELLNAQRSYNEIQLNYYQTLYDYTEALILLEKAAGIWDLTL